MGGGGGGLINDTFDWTRRDQFQGQNPCGFLRGVSWSRGGLKTGLVRSLNNSSNLRSITGQKAARFKRFACLQSTTGKKKKQLLRRPNDTSNLKKKKERKKRKREREREKEKKREKEKNKEKRKQRKKEKKKEKKRRK